MTKSDFEFDIALSYAREQGDYVEMVYNCLSQKGIKVYYDKDQEMWGKDLTIEFSEAFYKKSRFTVAFISKEYAIKNWTKHELKSAFARALTENGEYILPVRFDDTEIPGLLHSIDYKDARLLTPEQLCGLIIRKLGIKSDISIHQEEDIKIPQIKRKITDFEKDEFIQESFITLKNYFKQALKKTEAGHNNVRSSLEELTNSKFVAKIYVDGDLKSVCKIWIDKGYSSNLQIHYFEGDSRSGYNNDNSYNDSAYVEDNGIEIFFRIINMGFGIIDKNVDLNKASSKDLGVYFWKKFIKNLN